MDSRAEVREFLITRRGRITPEEAGVQTYGTRRRVSGLRREEVARLAGVSIDYYTRLERGNLSGASEEVLTAIARADDRDRLLPAFRPGLNPRQVFDDFSALCVRADW